MNPELPPPDPNETSHEPEDVGPIPAPIALFAHGRPSVRQDRLADAVLAWRPGLLFVLSAA